MGLFGMGKTETEKKRDDYDKLHDLLKDAIKEHDQQMDEAESIFRSYKSSVPNLSNSKIPSNEFDTKREKLTAKLVNFMDKEQEKRASLVRAKERAYDQYVRYKAQAIREDAAEKEKKEKERKEREARLENG
ncbi:chorismate synthase [Listeria goaensis]|uniref:chorismate synthase n=1 Tax=Listeria goaensis TaxID=1649188 RepID=UPI000B58C225|nr:chorismate synthase [Listeria goaensis]